MHPEPTGSEQDSFPDGDAPAGERLTLRPPMLGLREEASLREADLREEQLPGNFSRDKTRLRLSSRLGLILWLQYLHSSGQKPPLLLRISFRRQPSISWSQPRLLYAFAASSVYLQPLLSIRSLL